MVKRDAGDGRAPNKSSSAYKGADGYWHGRVSMGVDDLGKPDRRHVMGASRAEVARKVRELERLRDTGRAATAGRAPLVSVWLTHWLENIAARTVRRRTLDGYRTYIDRYAIPALGSHRLDRLQPEHVEALYARMERDGLAAGTVHSLHRILRAALNEAVRRDKMLRNPVTRARPPRLVEREMEPLTHQDAARLIDGGQPPAGRCSLVGGAGTRTPPGRGAGAVLGRRRPRRRHPHRPAGLAAAHRPARMRRGLRPQASGGLPAADPWRPRAGRAEDPGGPTADRPAGGALRPPEGPPAGTAGRAAARRHRVGGPRAGVLPADWSPDRPAGGLGGLEGAHPLGRSVPGRAVSGPGGGPVDGKVR